MSTPPTSHIPTTKPSFKARLSAKAKAYYEKATIHSDNSNRAFAVLVILGAVAALVTGIVLWSETTGEYASNTFIATGTTTLAVAVVVIAVILFFRSAQKPAVSQIIMIVALVFFVKLLMGWVYTAFDGVFSKGWWAVPFIGFVAFWASMVLLFMLIFKITAPQVENPELVQAKALLNDATVKRDKRQKEADDTAEAVKAATKAEKKSAKDLVAANDKFEEVTRKRDEAQKAHDKVVEKDDTVAAAEKKVADATEVLRVSKDALKKAKASHFQAAERQNALPGLIAQRQAMLDAAQAQLDDAVARLAVEREAFNANPNNVAVKADYAKAGADETVARRAVKPHADAMTNLTVEEAGSDKKLQDLLAAIPTAEIAVETDEKLVEAASKFAEDTRKALNEKPPTGEELVKAKKKEEDQRKDVEKAKAKSEADKTALKLGTSQLKTAGKLLGTAEKKLDEADAACKQVAEAGKRAQKKRWVTIGFLFFGFVATNIAIFGYIMTQL